MPYIAQHISQFTQREIQEMFKKALRAYKGPGLDLLLIPARKSFGRILVVTPRKVGNAPERNKIRRRLKALFYQEKLYQYPFDWGVIIKKPGIDLDTHTLSSLLFSVLKKASLDL